MIDNKHLQSACDRLPLCELLHATALEVSEKPWPSAHRQPRGTSCDICVEQFQGVNETVHLRTGHGLTHTAAFMVQPHSLSYTPLRTSE